MEWKGRYREGRGGTTQAWGGPLQAKWPISPCCPLTQLHHVAVSLDREEVQGLFSVVGLACLVHVCGGEGQGSCACEREEGGEGRGGEGGVGEENGGGGRGGEGEGREEWWKGREGKRKEGELGEGEEGRRTRGGEERENE